MRRRDETHFAAVLRQRSVCACSVPGGYHHETRAGPTATSRSCGSPTYHRSAQIIAVSPRQEKPIDMDGRAKRTIGISLVGVEFRFVRESRSRGTEGP